MGKLSLNEIKQQIEEYLNVLPSIYDKFFKEEAIIKKTNSMEFNTIPQNGFTYFESADITHFVVPTNKLCTTIEPYQYVHKVFVYNVKSNLFDTKFEGLADKCMEYILKYQEIYYKFSMKNRNEALIELNKIKAFFDWTSELLPIEFNEENQDKIIKMVEEAKARTGFEELLPSVDPEQEKIKANQRALTRLERKKAYLQ